MKAILAWNEIRASLEQALVQTPEVEYVPSEQPNIQFVVENKPFSSGRSQPESIPTTNILDFGNAQTNISVETETRVSNKATSPESTPETVDASGGMIDTTTVAGAAETLAHILLPSLKPDSEATNAETSSVAEGDENK